MIKIQTKTDTNCYAVPLNRTTAVTPSKVKIPTNVDTDTKVSDLVNSKRFSAFKLLLCVCVWCLHFAHGACGTTESFQVVIRAAELRVNFIVSAVARRSI